MYDKTFLSIGKMMVEVQYHYSIDGRLYGYPHIYSEGQEVYVRVMIFPFENVYKKMSPIIHHINGNFSGKIYNNYITVFENYGLLIINDISERTIYVGIKQGLWSDKSFYLIRSQINKHLLRFAYRIGVPLHASCVLNDDNDAILMIGTHGSGKSSFAKFMQDSGYKLINDDIVLYDMEKNQVSGFREGIYLRPEMIMNLSKDELNKVQDIAHGRKIFIEDEKKVIIKDKIVKYTILLDRNFQQPVSENREETDIYCLLENAHVNWTINEEETFLLKKAFSCLVKNTKCIYSNLQNKQQTIGFFQKEK